MRYHENIKKRNGSINTVTKTSEQKIQGQRGILQNDKMINPPRKHSDPKCVCTKQNSFKIHKTKTDKAKRRDKYFLLSN